MNDTKNSKTQGNIFFYLFTSGLILLISISVILSAFYIDYFPPTFFTINQETKQVSPLSTLSAPIITSESLLNWAQLATVSLNTFQSATIEEQINASLEKYFTHAGANSYLTSLKMKGTVKDVIAKKLGVSCIIKSPPVILHQGVLLGRYTWKVQVPVLISYTSLSDVRVSPQLITLTISVLPAYINPIGLGITQYNAARM